MKELIGSPGKASGLVLRTGLCLFAAASMGVMASAAGFSTSPAFCHLIASMGLQVMWSFCLACFDFHALRQNRELRTQVYVSLLVVGDWVAAILSFAAACSSAGVIVLFARDTNFCQLEKGVNCSFFKISVSLAFISWFLLRYVLASSLYLTISVHEQLPEFDEDTILADHVFFSISLGV